MLGLKLGTARIMGWNIKVMIEVRIKVTVRV
jgi:hypothetical protein